MSTQRVSPCFNSVLMQDSKWKKKELNITRIFLDNSTQINMPQSSKQWKDIQYILLSEFDYSNFSILTELFSAKQEETTYLLEIIVSQYYSMCHGNMYILKMNVSHNTSV